MLAEYSDAWASSQMYSEEIYRCSPTIGVIVREYCLAQYEASYPAGMQPAHLEGILSQSGQLQVTTAQGTETTVEAFYWSLMPLRSVTFLLTAAVFVASLLFLTILPQGSPLRVPAHCYQEAPCIWNRCRHCSTLTMDVP